MGKSTQPILKRCKALGISPTVLGYDKVTKRNPKDVRRKKSEYGTQLNEKQKVRLVYGVMEKQFSKYYELAAKKTGATGEVLLQILESRLDNVVFRCGFAKTRDEAKQMISHGHVEVNGSKVDISSYLVKAGDVVAIRERSRSLKGIKDAVAKSEHRTTPSWLEVNKENFSGKVLNLAERSDIDFPVEERLIVEFYSR